MKKIALLGATGSIGDSTLAVVRAHPDRFTIRALIAGSNFDRLAELAREFNPPVVAIADEPRGAALRERLHDTDSMVFAGAAGICEAIAMCDAEVCVSAIVGSAGLAPTLAAIDAGMDIALANKETLVAAGALVRQKIRAKGVMLLPVDSEHSALFQCLAGEQIHAVRTLTLTASGGPFRGMNQASLANVTPADALVHPTWTMGEKVTIDSATLANKALEVIEAHWLFDMPYEKIDVVVHPQSIVHGLVTFQDGSVIAQMGTPDMRMPIQYALSYPERLPHTAPPLSLIGLGSLEFIAPDRTAFPMLDLGIHAGQAGGTQAAVYSAANEEAVGLFLAEKIRFPEIAHRVAAALDENPRIAMPSLNDILAAEAAARRKVHASPKI